MGIAEDRYKGLIVGKVWSGAPVLCARRKEVDQVRVEGRVEKLT